MYTSDYIFLVCTGGGVPTAIEWITRPLSLVHWARTGGGCLRGPASSSDKLAAIAPQNGPQRLETSNDSTSQFWGGATLGGQQRRMGSLWFSEIVGPPGASRRGPPLPINREP